MARIRTIKPEFFTSETVGEWSDSTQIIFIGLWNHARDNGVGSANQRYLAGQIRPFMDQAEAVRRIQVALQECSRSGVLRLFTRGNRDFYAVVNWKEHQSIQKPTPAPAGFELPNPEEEAEYRRRNPWLEDDHETSDESSPDLQVVPLPEDYGRTTGGLREDYRLERKGKEGKGREGKNYVRDAARPAVQLPLTAEVVVHAEPPRPDVEALCDRLLAKLVETDYKPLPKITQVWRDQARLLLDKDERNVDQALRLIDWALENDFWSTNIASMGKFRTQYPKLLAAAKREHAARKGTAPPTIRSQRLEATAAMVARFRAEEEAESNAVGITNFARKALEG